MSKEDHQHDERTTEEKKSGLRLVAHELKLDDPPLSLLHSIVSWPNLINTVLRVFILVAKLVKDKDAGATILATDAGIETLNWLLSSAAITILKSIHYDVSAWVIALLPVVVAIATIVVTVSDLTYKASSAESFALFKKQAAELRPNEDGDDMKTLYTNEEEKATMEAMGHNTILSDAVIRRILTPTRLI